VKKKMKKLKPNLLAVALVEQDSSGKLEQKK